MQDLETRATKRYNERRRSTARKYGIGLLALLVLLCTAAALLLPAFTLEKDVFCGLEEHTHTEACYELVPVCVVEEHAAHTHTDACFETARELSCGLEESEGHTHTDACFKEEKALTCVLEEDEGHAHTDACYIEEREPVCGIVETEGHAHDDSCWSTEQDLVCELEENEEHQHDDACYIETSVLVCGEEEREAHTHDESCYVTRLVPNCGEEEREGHTHTDECYTVKQKLVCELPEDAGHTHTDACYTDTQKLICTLPEDEGHTHSEACMEEKLVCEKEEHTHSLQCYSNPEAVESEAAWVLSFPTFGEDATHLERLLGIAESQLGYQESAENYLVDENKSLHGYTRFGDFCGEPYADWNAMFVSFCLHYAGIDPAIFPAEGDAQSMIDALTEKELYIPNGTEGFLPRPGDLIFFDNIYTGTYTVRVGIVTSVDRELGVLNVMEGDSADSVAECRYALDDTTILGYGVLPEALRAEADAEADTTAESTDTKDADTKAADTKADETKADETKADETKADETKDGETKADETKADETKADETKNGETKADETKADETKDDETKDTDTKDDAKTGDAKDADSEPNITESKLKMKAGNPMLLGDPAQLNLVDLTNGGGYIRPTETAYKGLERGQEVELKFHFKIANEHLTEALQNNWYYDLSNYIGDGPDKIFSSIDGVTGGQLMSGTDIVGSYEIKDGKFIIKPNPDLLIGFDHDLEGSFTFDAKVNKNFSPEENVQTITFPGEGTSTFQFNEKKVNHSKTVSATEGGSSAQGDSAQLVEENGKYYLYYKIHMQPHQTLDSLSFTDTLSAGQKLDADSIKLNGESVSGQNVSDSGFSFDVAQHLEDQGKTISDWQNFDVTYRAEITDVDALKAGNLKDLTNEANYTWTGDTAKDKTTVNPKFDKELYSSKAVGGLDGVYVGGGNVDVIKDGDGFYLEYRITATPNTETSNLTITDTIGAGQELVAGSVSYQVGNDGSVKPASVTSTDSGFTYKIPETVSANTPVIMTYRVKLTPNTEGDTSPLGSPKTNTAKWTWEGKPSENTTTVTPKEPEPRFGVTKSADALEAGPGDEVTYTITIVNPDPGHVDLKDYPFNDYIANYPFTVKPESFHVTNSNGTEISTGDPTWNQPDTTTAPGSSYKLFTYNFPEGSKDREYTITYTIKLGDDGNAGTRALINRAVIGEGEDNSNTTVDYDKPTVKKNWTEAGTGTDDNIVAWTIRVEVPKDKSFKDVVVKESDFMGGPTQWDLKDLIIDWTSLNVYEDDGTGKPKGDAIIEGDMTYKVNPTENTITFPELNASRIITLNTKLPDGLKFADLAKQGYYVKNTASLTVKGEGVDSSTDSHTYAKQDYSFTKDGVLQGEKTNDGRPLWKWTVTINNETLELDPDILRPVFTDTIPEEMELYPADGKNVKVSFYARIQGINRDGNKVSPGGEANIHCTPRDNEFGFNIVEELRKALGQYVNAPEGVSGVQYTITYSTTVTEELWAEMKETVDNYSFTNKTKLLDEDGGTLKTTEDTVTYEYKNVIDKVGEAINNFTLEYKVKVNPEGLKLNNGKDYTVYDKLSTDLTLDTTYIKVYEGAETEADLVYPKEPTPVIVSYDDNTRTLAFSLPDGKAYIIVFRVAPTPNKDNKYSNTVVLRTDTLQFKDTEETEHEFHSGAEVHAAHGDFSLLKTDQFNPASKLKNAVFKLYEVELANNYAMVGEPKRLPDATTTFTSNENGVVEFTGVDFMEGKLYCWQETEPADGHVLTDESMHYFCIYNKYTSAGLTKGDNYEHHWSYDGLTDGLKVKIRSFLEMEPNTTEPFSVKEIMEKAGDDAEKKAAANLILSELAGELSQISFDRAENLDHGAQDANNIIVLSELSGYQWTWRNPDDQTAQAVLKGTKLLHGLDLEAGEFAFRLDDMSMGNEDDPTRVQIVKNDANGDFAFSALSFKKPGIYHYQITEYPGKNSVPGVIYDTTKYQVEIEVLQSDIGNRAGVPEERIRYYKNGQEMEKAFFNNIEDKASLTIIKTFSGDFIKTDAFENSGVKDNLRFEIRKKKTGELIKTVFYSEMSGGTYTLTEGIESNTVYTVTEKDADIPGAVRTTIYSSVREPKETDWQKNATDTATVNTNGDKPAFVNYDNSYEPQVMKMKLKKLWYSEGSREESGSTVETMELATAPNGVDEIFFKLQRYERNGWNFVDKKYETEYLLPVNGLYAFDDYYILSPTMSWAKELENMPLGKYRAVEIEKVGDGDPQQWKIVDQSDVVYLNNQEITLHNGYAVAKDVSGSESGILDGKDGTVYICNRTLELDFVKAWKDKDGQNVTDPFEKYNIQSITFQLMQATSPDDEATPVAGKTWTMTSANQDEPIHFDGLLSQDKEGNDLYYSVTEKIILNDDTELNPDSFAIMSADGETPFVGVEPSDEPQAITNVEQPIGITIKKVWNNVDAEERQTVYVQMQAFYNNSFHIVNDPDIKTDAGNGPILGTDGLYAIEWNDTSNETITFSNLFRYYDGKFNEQPKYDNADVSMVKFVEFRKNGDAYEEFSGDTYMVTYSFEGKNGPQDARDGISPTENGTLTITNSKRESTKLMVTKSWPEKKDTKIYYQVHLVAEDGADGVLGLYDSNGIQNNEEKHIHYGSHWSNSVLFLKYDSVNSAWETAEFEFPKKMNINGSSKYLAGVYVVEVGEDGTPLDNNNDGMTDLQTENWKITYTFDGKTVSKSNPVPAGSNGPLTIKNGDETPPSIDLKIVKVDANDLSKELDQARKLVATFTLKRSDSPDAATNDSYAAMDTYTKVSTGVNGELKFENLLDGYYRLVEVNAPRYYVNSGEPFDFTVKDGVLTAHDSRLIVHDQDVSKPDGGKVYTYKIGNEKGVELPSTGGVGVGVYRIGGAALLLAATGLAAAESLKRSRADRARRRKGGEGET